MEQGPHINHAGWLPSVRKKRGFRAHANCTDICCRKVEICNGTARGRAAHNTYTCLTHSPRPNTSLPISSSSLSISTAPAQQPNPHHHTTPRHTHTHNIPSYPQANQATGNACMQAIEMGHFLIKYNINYCEHHYRYVRFD